MTFWQVLRKLQDTPLVSFKTSRPQQARKRLYAAARRRGLLWRFATLDDEVFVTR